MNRKQTLQSMVRYLQVRHDIELEISDPDLENKLMIEAKKIKDRFFDEYWSDHLNMLVQPLELQMVVENPQKTVKKKLAKKTGSKTKRAKKKVKKIPIDSVIEPTSS